MKLLQKEFRLCMHPTALLMPLLGGLVLVPGYPYAVCFFYMTLAIYFVCLTGRENHDAAFTLSLPVSRREMARARILFACCLEGFQLAAVALAPRRPTMAESTYCAATCSHCSSIVGHASAITVRSRRRRFIVISTVVVLLLNKWDETNISSHIIACLYSPFPAWNH